MDPLSISASLIAVIQVTGSVISICYDYRQGAKYATKEIVQISDELSSLRDVLDSLLKLVEKSSASNGVSQLSTFEILLREDGPLLACSAELEKLKKTLEPEKGWRAVKKTLVWPLKEGDVQKTLGTLERLKSTLQLGLSADQTNLTLDLTNRIETQFNDQTRQDIFQWLGAPDSFTTHEANFKKHKPTTGKWFLTSRNFENWYRSPASFFWIYGIPGSGKTVLCSSIIQHLTSNIERQPKTAIAYFYFDFNGDITSMLKSLIAQLSVQSEGLPTPLKDLYNNYHKKTSSSPTDEALLQAFHDILLSFHNVYITFDALDEASRNDELLSFITKVQGWQYQRLHLLVTSRQLSEIEDTLSDIVTGKICLQNSEIRHDIEYYVMDILANDKTMSKWPRKLRMEIQNKLVYEGDGMFRWVVCQLDMFRKCTSVTMIRKAMTTLPKSLDETYERILEQIDESYHADVRKILQALTVAKKSLTVDELVEVLAVNFDCENELPQFDEDSRLLDPRTVLTMCSSLVTRLEGKYKSWRDIEEEDEEKGLKFRWHEGYARSTSAPVRLAHASVADYLTQPKQSQFCFTRHAARQFMAQACLAYLLNPEFSSGHDRALLMQRHQDYPLLRHITLNWPLYVRREEGDPVDYLAPCTKQLLQAFFASHKLPGGGNYAFWLGMMMPSAPPKAPYLTGTHPLYYAASFGLADVVRIMLDSDKDIDIDELGGRAHATALHVACFRNHPEVVKILLERGADPNLANDVGESPLYFAIYHDSKSEMVELLLKYGAHASGRQPLRSRLKTGARGVQQV